MITPSHLEHGLWRLPESRSAEFTELDFWIEMSKMIEDAKVDGVFFADVLGLYEATEWKDVVKNAVQFPSNDPMVMISALAQATKHLGFIYTSTVTAVLPFMFARQASSLDHLTKGRIGWNVVSGSTGNGARSLGTDGLNEHSKRYNIADEYLEVTYKLWEGSQDDGALIRDKERGWYTDPKKVHKIHHSGEYFKVEGPHQVPPSPQRTPLVFQAGSSGPGLAFAGKNAEGVFLISGSPEAAKKKVDSIKEAAVEAGRDPEEIHFVEGVTLVIGETMEEAKKKEQYYDANASVPAHALQMIGATGLDISKFSPDTLLEDIMDQVPGFTGPLTHAIDRIKDRKATVQDLAASTTTLFRIVGTPATIADRFQQYLDVGITGFNIVTAIMDVSVTDFCDLLAPELKKRGMMKTEYSPGTFREKLFPGNGPFLSKTHPGSKYRGIYGEDE